MTLADRCDIVRSLWVSFPYCKFSTSRGGFMARIKVPKNRLAKANTTSQKRLKLKSNVKVATNVPKYGKPRLSKKG